MGKERLVMVDRKDYLVGTKCSDTTIQKCQYSSKTEKSAARDLTFSTSARLVFESLAGVLVNVPLSNFWDLLVLKMLQHPNGKILHQEIPGLQMMTLFGQL